MFKKKTEITPVTESPIRVKLEEALSKIEAHIKAFEDGHHADLLSEEHNWQFAIYKANDLLGSPLCETKDQVRELREIAVEQFRTVVKQRYIADAQIEEMKLYKSTISEALLKLGPIESFDDLSQRINALKALKPMNAIAEANNPLKDYEVYDDIRPTLYAVDALISLQKEDVKP